MTATAFTVVAVDLRLEQGGQVKSVEFAASFDQVRSQDAARSVGRQIGEALGENLARRLQHGEVLA